MRSDKKKVLTNSLLYTSGNVLLKFFSFLLIPLYTSFLTPDQYGIVNLALGFVAVVSLIIMSGLQFSIFRFYADIKDNSGLVAKMISSVFCSLTITGIAISCILIISQKIWCKIIFDDIPFIPIVLLAILISLVSAVYTVYQDMLKGMQQAKKSVVLSYLFFFLLLILNIITVVTLRWGANGILISTFAVNFFMVCIMVIDLRSNRLLNLELDTRIIKELFHYSLPLVPHTLAYSITNLFSKVIVNTKLSTSMLGLYSLASQFGGVADVVSNSVQSAFQPWLFVKLNDKDNYERSEIEVRTLTNQLLWLYGLIYIIIGAFSKEVIDFMTVNSYHSAWQYIPFLIMAVAIKSPLYFYLNFLYYHKNATKYVFITTLYGCVASISLTWLLVPVLGIYGAICADIAALVIRFFITYRYSIKYVGAIYNLINIAFITLISVFFLALSVIPSYVDLGLTYIAQICYKTVCIFLYCGLITVIYKKKGVDLFKIIHSFRTHD